MNYKVECSEKLQIDTENENLDSGYLTGECIVRTEENLDSELISSSHYSEEEDQNFDSGVISTRNFGVESRVLDEKKSKIPDILESELDENGNTLLHRAVLKNDLNQVTEILKTLKNLEYLNVTNYYSFTCLHLSSLMNNYHITRKLYLSGAKTNIEDDNGNTALHLASLKNNMASVCALLQQITNDERMSIGNSNNIDNVLDYINERNYDGKTCLHLASLHEDFQIMTALIDCRADINAYEYSGGYTVFHEAVETKNVKLVEFLLKFNSLHIDFETYGRKTAFQLSSNCPTIRKILVEAGCNINENYVDDGDDEDSDSDSDWDSEEGNNDDSDEKYQ